MSLAAYPGGIDEIKKTPEWRDAVASRLKFEAGESFDRTQIENPRKEIEKAAIADVLRVCLKIHYSLGIRPNGGVECGSWR
jgi:hypothetical protein